VTKSETAGCWLNEEPFELHGIFPVARVCTFWSHTTAARLTALYPDRLVTEKKYSFTYSLSVYAIGIV